MVIDPDVQGTVDIVLTDVPWDQALDVILRGNQLDYTVDGTIVRIAQDRDAAPRAGRADAAGAVGGQRRRAGGAHLHAQLREGGSGGAAGQELGAVAARQRADRRPHQHADHHRPAGAARHRAAAARRRSTAPSRRSKSRRASSRRRATSRARSACSGASTAASIRTSATPRTWRSRTTARSAAARARRVRAAPIRARQPVEQRGHRGRTCRWSDCRPTSAIGLALGSINGAFNLDVALSALERTGKGRILSTPRVTTQNNVEAEITQGVQIPIQTEANNTVTTTFKDAALTLKVTPQITAANTVIMQITLENAAPGSQTSDGDSVDQHAARHHPRAGQRRHDDGHRRHLRQPRAVDQRSRRRCCTAFRSSAGCSSATARRTAAASC